MEFLNIPVDEYSSPVSITATEEMDAISVLDLMSERGIRHVPVVKDGRPIGIISDRDLRLISTLEIKNPPLVGDFMVKEPFCVQLGTSIDQVAFEMSTRKIGSALVVDQEGRLDGIFTSTDGLNALIEVVRGDVDS